MATNDRVSRVHAPAYLQSFSLGFRNREMIADRVSPRIRVGKQSDKYRVFGKQGLQVHESRWAPGTVPNEIRTRWSEASYFADERKLRTSITDSERRNSDNDIDLETKATATVTDALIISRESRVASLFTTPGNYSAGQKITKAGGAEWDQAAVVSTAQPLIDIMALVSLVSRNAMIPVSALSVVIPEVVFTTALWNNSAILDRIKYSNTGVVTSDLLKAALGVKEVIFAPAMTISGPDIADADVVTGLGTPTVLWGDTVWVGLVNEGQNDNAPSFSRSFNWTAATNGQERRVITYRDGDEGKETDWVESKEAVDERIVYADAGGIIINTLSTI
jgi:hypothetical protein